MKIVCLSHPLNSDTPLYPGTPEPEFSRFKSMADGDSANSSNAKVNVHTGTHLDFPLHFCPEGEGISEFSGHELVFDKSYCVEIKKNGDEPIVPEDFANIRSEFTDAEAILVKTGSGSKRGRNNGYERNHPWIDPELPAFLRDKFPELRLFGLDAISVASPNHRNEGREAHRRFLCSERPLLLLEDADLSGLSGRDGAFMLRIYPYFYENIDASPVTALAIINFSDE